MPSVSEISSHIPNDTRRGGGWAFAIYLDEVVLLHVVDASDGKNKVQANIFRVTSNQLFWPYTPHKTLEIPRPSILRVLPRSLEPPCIPHIFEARSMGRVSVTGPVNLSDSAWRIFIDVRSAYHARIRARSLALRKHDRHVQRLRESRAA